jgi:hypothetical protein
MARTRKDFFDDFDELMRLNDIINSLLPPTQQTAGLKTLMVQGEEVTLEDIVRIVNGIWEDDREQINKWRVLAGYLHETLDIIEDNQSIESRPRYYLIYGDDFDEIREIENNMEIIIRRLLNDLSDDPNEFARFFGLMKPSEQMALASLGRQGIRTAAATATTPERRKRLPPEMIGEIAPFVGYKPKGGRTKMRRNKMKRNKTMRTKKGKGRKMRKNKTRR